MTNLDARMEELRKQMEELYMLGDKEAALQISQRLDKLIILAQRENAPAERSILPRST